MHRSDFLEEIHSQYSSIGIPISVIRGRVHFIPKALLISILKSLLTLMESTVDIYISGAFMAFANLLA